MLPCRRADSGSSNGLRVPPRPAPPFQSFATIPFDYNLRADGEHSLRGPRLGPYEIVAPLGAGGMGEVYRARDAKLGRDVALEVLPAAFAGDPEPNCLNLI